MNSGFEPHLANGLIDFDFYRAEAARERRMARTGLMRALLPFVARMATAAASRMRVAAAGAPSPAAA
jgi:hypothetical protein